MRRLGRGLALAIVALGSLVGPVGPQAQAMTGVQMSLEGAELGPFAYTHFCVTYPAECRAHAGREPDVKLTPERRAELADVNARVNRAIVPAPHAGRGTFDTWTIAPARGDCNDYAVTKRHVLMEHGWPSRALLLAEVITSWGDHHLVLVARTTEGDFVLDNLSGQVRPWTAPNYRWVRAQMPDEPALWSRVGPPPRQLAARSVGRADVSMAE